MVSRFKHKPGVLQHFISTVANVTAKGHSDNARSPREVGSGTASHGITRALKSGGVGT